MLKIILKLVAAKLDPKKIYFTLRAQQSATKKLRSKPTYTVCFDFASFALTKHTLYVWAKRTLLKTKLD